MSDKAPCARESEYRVLISFLYRPAQIPNYHPEITDLLWTYDYQTIWQVMRQMDTTLSPGDFQYALFDTLRVRHPRTWERLWSRIVNDTDEVSARPDKKRFLTFADHVAILERASLARRLIDTAQVMAECAWRLDTEGALTAAERWYHARSTPKAPGVAV